jgi:hypothetical protein
MKKYESKYDFSKFPEVRLSNLTRVSEPVEIDLVSEGSYAEVPLEAEVSPCVELPVVEPQFEIIPLAQAKTSLDLSFERESSDEWEDAGAVLESNSRVTSDHTGYTQDVLEFEDGWKKQRFDIFELMQRSKFEAGHYLNNYLPKEQPQKETRHILVAMALLPQMLNNKFYPGVLKASKGPVVPLI